MLRAARVARFVDVRAIPRSRRWPQYDGEALEERRSRRRGSNSIARRRPRRLQEAARRVAERRPGRRLPRLRRHMATTDSRARSTGYSRQPGTRRPRRQCAEKLPAACHRILITDYVLARGVEVVHVVAPEMCAPGRRLSPAARAVPGGLVYDGGGQPPAAVESGRAVGHGSATERQARDRRSRQQLGDLARCRRLGRASRPWHADGWMTATWCQAPAGGVHRSQHARAGAKGVRLPALPRRPQRGGHGHPRDRRRRR